MGEVINFTTVVRARLLEAAPKLESSGFHLPAYCDPENERVGVKHAATRNLSLTDIAKRMRADIKAAFASKQLPDGLKVSVRTKYYSGGGSIDIDVTAFPTGFVIYNPDWLRHEHETRNVGWMHFHGETFSPEWSMVKATLKAIHGAYNRNNSDAMSDYFDVRYYGDVGIHWQISHDIRKNEQARALLEMEA
jgi:hypothetical protein